MQKLEEILHAEEQARNTLAEAERGGEALLREASVQASAATESSRQQAEADARRVREERIGAAQAEAAAIESASSQTLDAALSQAEDRIAKAVASVVSELVG